jgi:hypothetical protein
VLSLPTSVRLLVARWRSTGARTRTAWWRSRGSARGAASSSVDTA